MSTRAQQYDALVLRREQLSPHLIRLTLGSTGDGESGLSKFVSTGIPDEWVGLVVPGQFQSRYYTVRSWVGGELTLDVVVHDVGLVTEWAARDVVGDTVTITEPKGSFAMPADAGWLLLVGDLTAMPAMARIVENGRRADDQDLGRGGRPAELERIGYLPDTAEVTWLEPAGRRGQQPGRGGRGDRLAAPVTDTSGWRGSPRRCGRSASTSCASGGCRRRRTT